MASQDPRGFYAALNVGPAASQMEIRLAYKFLKSAYRDGKKFTNIGKVRSAYMTLSDPKLRAQYDGHAEADPSECPQDENRSRLHSIPLLIASLSLFVAAFVLSTGATSNWVTFKVGDELIWKQTLKQLGTIVEYDKTHDFPEADTQAAYRVETRSGTTLWFAAKELHRGTRTR